MVLGDINVPLPRLALPPTPSDPERSRLPLLALLAPIILALALWPLTGSPMMLAFAALSPVIALATAFEQRRALRRAKASRTAQRGQLLEQLERDVASRLDRLRVAAWGVAPTGRHVLGERVGDGWRAAPPGRLVLGSGSVPSGITLEGDATDERERLAVQAAAILTDAPVDCSAFGGIGFVGPLPLARAAARALLVQVAHGWAPHQARFVAPSGPNWEWLSGLPHHDGVVCTVYEIAGDHPSVAASVTRAPSAHLAGNAAPSAEIQVFVASRRDQLPATISTVATVRAPGEAVIGRCDGADTEAPIRPGMVSQAECHSWAQRVAEDPRSTSAVGGKLPTAVELTDLPQMTRGSGSVAMRLTVPIGATAYEPVSIDLVSGPHALVAGTTGSGKSELLIAWVAALARDYSPSEVSFLLIDFKGGAAFAPLTDLPHVLGVVTDLDGAAALRAVESLQSELRRREELLRAAGAREIADLPVNRQCGRLVIVIDEFQAVLDQYPDVAQVVADVAARGRSLGMHLVLATQRPGGVVREQVTANCGIRICLRVLAPADSVAVIGDDRAAQLSVKAPGRVVIDGGDGDIRVAQGALVTPGDLAAIQARWRDAPTAHRPWLPPLPASLPMAKVEPHRAPGRYPFGFIDDPANQSQPVAFWDPVTDHNLLVIGPPRSGRSTTLSAIASSSFEPVSTMPPGDADAWEFLELLERGSIGSGVVLIDDLDVRFRTCNDEYRHTALQRLELLVRAAPAGLVFAASAARPQSIPPGLREQFGAQVLLRHQSKADLVQAGGDPTLWFANAPVGSGQWMGRTLQVANVPAVRGDTPRTPPVLTVDRARVTIVVGEPAVAARFDSMSATTIEQLSDPEVCARLATCPPTGPVIVLGAAEHWARSWQLLAALRPNADVVVVGTLADLRAVTNSRALPPLLAAGECWLITASGAIERRRLPT